MPDQTSTVHSPFSHKKKLASLSLILIGQSLQLAVPNSHNLFLILAQKKQARVKHNRSIILLLSLNINFNLESIIYLQDRSNFFSYATLLPPDIISSCILHIGKQLPKSYKSIYLSTNLAK